MLRRFPLMGTRCTQRFDPELSTLTFDFEIQSVTVGIQPWLFDRSDQCSRQRLEFLPDGHRVAPLE